MAKENATAQLVMTIPGIGKSIAVHILAEAEDIFRLTSYRNLSSYAGLVPSLDASEDNEIRGRITKQGSPYLRTALIGAAHIIPSMRKTKLNVLF